MRNSPRSDNYKFYVLAKDKSKNETNYEYTRTKRTAYLSAKAFIAHGWPEVQIVPFNAKDESFGDPFFTHIESTNPRNHRLGRKKRFAVRGKRRRSQRKKACHA